MPPDKLFHVVVAPCYDRKLEALGEDFQDVDCVLTSGEGPHDLDPGFGNPKCLPVHAQPPLDPCVCSGQERPGCACLYLGLAWALPEQKFSVQMLVQCSGACLHMAKPGSVLITSQGSPSLLR